MRSLGGTGTGDTDGHLGTGVQLTLVVTSTTSQITEVFLTPTGTELIS